MMKHLARASGIRLLSASVMSTLATVGLVVGMGAAHAHQNPNNCDSTGVNLSITVLRADGVTPVGAGTVVAGETIKYRATLSHAGGSNCNYDGGDLDIITPNGANNDVDGGAIPLVASGTPFVGALATYVVNSANVSGGFLSASAVYSGGTSHINGPGVTPIGASAPALTAFVKLNPTITTQVHNPAHTDVTNTTVDGGIAIHDQVTVGAVQTGPTPTGTGGFVLMSGTECIGQVISSENYTLNGSGVAESTPGVLPDGPYSYLVRYNGDANYNVAQAACEPFTLRTVLPLVVEKTAVATYDRSWSWTIVKRANTGSLVLAEGEIYEVDYEVALNATPADVNVVVTGSITVTNPVGNLPATITGVTDTLSIDAGPVSVVCPGVFPQVLAPGASLVCTYSEDLTATDDQVNTATVTTSGQVPGGFDDANVVFGNPVNEIDECITVDDTNPLGPQDVVICSDTVDKLLEYDVTFGTPVEADVEVVCGDNSYVNTASFVTTDDANDTDATGNDGHTVDVEVACVLGCTLTQGYWKTHNDSFKGGAPTDDNWTNVTPAGENSGFFTTANFYPVVGPNVGPLSWFTVFWTPPKGNAYYNLAHQYMAAKLNVLNGAVPPPSVASAITSAEDFFDTYTPAAFNALGKKHALRTSVLNWAGTLGSFNEGAIGPGHCDENPV